jgi:hypothetical protein
MDYKVEIDQSGRGGSIRYIENGQALVFDWEFAIDGAYVFVPTAEQWDAYWQSNNLSWAQGRRQEILERLSEEVRQQKAQSSKVTVEDSSIHFQF